ncbi:LysR family transcriptional regulator [Pseudosulfitobacter koreensis]|uniref:LysR family transcriptional regulator n=1 Tax=Pseudosulfitobacter koreensis TaxID=2968472 RepID=A0ABT1YVR8_9RHOB|nr:LysR family transcriptional regulator [Pseudosulfitobacter koreense]MCR8824985.1 LysR family transcriptional regulator [Pseudosulfitobacter koreense]
MDNWDEIKTAYQVARMGTVSGAADVLGVHHATVIRHVDALEARLGVKLFQRHARGYTATEAGEDLLRVAKATDDQFSQLVGRIKGRGTDVSGDLVVTSLTSLVPRMVPILTQFQRENPDVVIRYLTGTRLFRLEYGEAHVAIRAGSPPAQPDNVVQSLARQRMGLFAARRYAEERGLPESWAECSGHRFVGTNNDQSRAPFNKWLRDKVPDVVFSFRSEEDRAIEQAILNGAGIGFASVLEARANPDLIEVFPHDEEWSAPLWLVTHVDLHRTTKVQAFLTFLKDAAKDWDV